jgi:DNA-directed RNA polymerase subunit beta
LATALIPFIEHNDANRALMGSNMQRQAVPLLYTQKPIVGTGLESVAILDSGMVVKSYSQGKVKFSSSSFIQIEDFGIKHEISIKTVCFTALFF